MTATTEIDLQRALVLLRAARDLLRKCNEGPYVEDALGTTVFYDEADCDGMCLMEDIEAFLRVDEDEPVLAGGVEYGSTVPQATTGLPAAIDAFSSCFDHLKHVDLTPIRDAVVAVEEGVKQAAILAGEALRKTADDRIKDKDQS